MVRSSQVIGGDGQAVMKRSRREGEEPAEPAPTRTPLPRSSKREMRK